MFGFAFALVPLYDTLCRVLGINGKIEPIEHARPASAPVAREVRVELVTTGSEDLGWRFYPLVRTLTARPGEMYEVQFHAKNMTDRPMTVRAIPSVTPTGGAAYMIKTDCFCFEKQTLEAGTAVKMPLAFYVDPGLPKKYSTLTLSYTLLATERQ